MDPVKTFHESAVSYGLAVAVLITLCAGLLIIIWKLGNRLTASHEKYLDETAGSLKADVAEIKATLPTICNANCPQQDFEKPRPRSAQKHAAALILVILCTGIASAQIRPDRKSWVNGITHEGESITCDLPNEEQMANIGSKRDGAGMCVFTSIEMAARYHGLDQMRGYRDWVATNYAGGGWPEKVDKTLAAYFIARGIEPVPYAQFEGPDPQPMLSLVEKTGRMSSITYGYSPRYGRGIAHMVNGIHFGPKFGVVLDNNFVGDNKYEWMSSQELIRRARLNGGRQGSAWIFTWLASSPPPPPKLKRSTGGNHACVCWPFCDCGSCRCP